MFPQSTRTPFLPRAIGLLLILHAGTLAYAALANSVTFDEYAHLAAGVAYWTHRALFIYCQSPPLLRWWGALPALLVGVRVPSVQPMQSLSLGDMPWYYGEAFLRANFAIYPQLVVLSRLWMIPISCLGAWLAYRWAQELYGRRAGVAVCAVYVLTPAIASRGSLITTDAGTTAAMLAACWLWWRFCQDPTPSRALQAALVIAAAHLCKFTALLLWPAMLVMAVWFAMVGRWRKAPRLAAGVFITGLVTLLVINAAYGFHGIGRSLDSYELMSATLQHLRGWLPRVPIPLPEEFVRGFDWQKFEAEGYYAAYLLGKPYYGAVWYYFPVALLCKLPLSILALAGLAAWSFVRSCRAGWPQHRLEVPLLTTVFIIGMCTSILVQLNIGIRYLLPVFPLAFILMGRLWSVPQAGAALPRWTSRVATGLLLTLAVEHAMIAPRYLTFFNAAVGGPSRGWRVLADLDEGQGLIELRRWMPAHNVSRIALAYFGSVDPAVYRIDYTPVAWPNERWAEGLPQELTAGYVGVSSVFLSGLTHAMPTPQGWTPFLCSIPFWRELQVHHPVAVVASTIFIYRRDDFVAAWTRWKAGPRSRT